MSDQQQGPGWWWASDGKWYPPESFPGRAQGWWVGSDGKWYPPAQAAKPMRTTQEKIVANAAAGYVIGSAIGVLLAIAFVVWLLA